MTIGHGDRSILIEMEGTFDLPAATRVAEVLADTACDLDVCIDLTHVRDFHDFGVAVLAKALAGRAHVDVRGLRTHQLRLLRYLGVDTRASAMA